MPIQPVVLLCCGSHSSKVLPLDGSMVKIKLKQIRRSSRTIAWEYIFNEKPVENKAIFAVMKNPSSALVAGAI